MEFQVLGRFGYRTDGDWVRPRGALRTSLLGVFLSRPGQVISHGVLTEALWPRAAGSGHDPDRLVGRLHLHAHRLRLDLDRPDRLVADRSGYLLQVEEAEYDAARFEALARRALAADPHDTSRAELARQALAQWPDPWDGEAFPGLDVPAVSDAAQRLAQVRLDVTEVLFDAEIRSGRHLDVLAQLGRVAADHPLREPLQACLMQALHQAGRPAEALEVYALTRRRLVEELGMEPSATLRQAQERVLVGGPDGPAGPPGAPIAAPPHATSTGALPVPAQLPPPVRLVGRATEMAHLDRVLGEQHCTAALITGLPGVGKSALAVGWAMRHRQDYADGQLFVDLRSYGPGPERAVEEVLDRFIRALGGSPAGLHDLDERTAAYRSLLAGRRVVIVLDNTRSEDQVRPFLPGEPGCTMLVTSRDVLTGLLAREGAQHLGLAPLGPAASVDLLRSLVEPAAAEAHPDAEEDLAALATQCAGLPVALRVAALRAGTTLMQTGPAEVLDLLDVGDPMTSARTIFSWSVDALAADDLRLFLALGVNPGSRVDLGGLAALAGVDPVVASAGLDRLVRANLVHVTEGWIWQHDLLSAYARERAGEGLAQTEHEAMLGRLLSYYERRMGAVAAGPEAAGAEFGDARRATAWVDQALQPVVELVERAPESADATVITCSLHLNQGLKARGEHRLARRLWESTLLAAERRGDLAATARVTQALASVVATLGERSLSEQLWDRARRLALESEDLVVQMVVHNNFANVLQGYGAFPRALAHLRRALRLAQMAQDRRENPVRGNIGLVLVKLERDEEAADLLAFSLERAADAAWRARVLRDRAMLSLRRAQVDEADHDLREALALATQTSSWVLATELRVMQGQVLARQGELEAARALLERAMGEATRQDEQVEVMGCLIALGRVDMEDHPQAASLRFEEALGRARREGAREMEFRALLALADLYDQQGQHARADAVRGVAGQVRQECGLAAVQTYQAW